MGRFRRWSRSLVWDVLMLLCAAAGVVALVAAWQGDESAVVPCAVLLGVATAILLWQTWLEERNGDRD